MPDMPAPDVAARFDFALQLIQEAGDHAAGLLLDRVRLAVRSKGLQDMASQADIGTELLIRERLAAQYPEDGFLGEETGASDLDAEQGIWVVDPIDGTQPFISACRACRSPKSAAARSSSAASMRRPGPSSSWEASTSPPR
jgi:myo-inositol-1(or 4)-monophosphatase